jgi:predicted nucleic acid-binding protein
MTAVFLDTNILLDVLANRKPFSKTAITIFQRAQEGKLALFTSTYSIATVYYLTKSGNRESDLRTALQEMMGFVKPLAVDASILQKALRSEHKDFEDAIQIFTELSNPEISCILTRNVKDFQKSPIPVYPPDEFVLRIKV